MSSLSWFLKNTIVAFEYELVIKVLLFYIVLMKFLKFENKGIKYVLGKKYMCLMKFIMFLETKVLTLNEVQFEHSRVIVLKQYNSVLL
jgi:hypothetical protein